MRVQRTELRVVNRTVIHRSQSHTRNVRPMGSDFCVGRIQLASHLRANGLASVDVDPRFARQLLLKEPSDFASGRVPLFVCECCGDLGCGALTVAVKRLEGEYVWSEFGYEGLDSTSISAGDYIARTGPFAFHPTAYESALLPYARKR